MRKSKRILVVEDNPITVGALQVLLAEDGYEVDHAGDGLGALDRLELQRPDVLLLDYRMPGMDGLQLLQRVRQDARFHDLPVVLITAVADADCQRLLQETASCQPVRVLRKPFEHEELIQMIEESESHS